MTTGALIFAFNNEHTDYVAMAVWNARNIRRHLDIPVAIVTDVQSDHPGLDEFEQVIHASADSGGTRYFDDYAATVTWHNAGRVDAYSLTPWDQTLVLDADYVVASNNLDKILASSSDFLCHRKAYDMATAADLDDLNKFGQHSMPMWWATVMMFRKSTTAQFIFECMQMVRNNWEHYRELYGINQRNYRNDHALSIALNIVSGQTGVVDQIPWPLASVMPNIALTKNKQPDSYSLHYKDSQHRSKYLEFANLDFHAMGKKHLGDIVEANS